MNGPFLHIGRIRRFTQGAQQDEIELKPGVNVLVGAKDTGKTGWLNTISYLLGDTAAPEHSLSPGVAARFSAAELELTIGAEQFLVARSWKEAGAKHKVFINGEPISSREFSEWVYGKLEIPRVWFPKGNPYAGATWPELTWRSLFRHIYREERFWNDLAEKQPALEQHASILQFLGAAESLYPRSLGELVRNKERLLRLRARKEQFEEILRQASTGLLGDVNGGATLTIDAILAASAQLHTEIATLRDQRELVISQALEPTHATEGVGMRVERDLAARRAQLSTQRDSLGRALASLTQRIQELAQHQESVVAENERMKRATVAESAFRPLSVKRCPHCDQTVSHRSAPPGCCFVCQQVLPAALTDQDGIGTKRRLEFEREQLEEENQELVELLQKSKIEQAQILAQAKKIDISLAEVDVSLRPIRRALSALPPPGLELIDTTIGRLLTSSTLRRNLNSPRAAKPWAGCLSVS